MMQLQKLRALLTALVPGNRFYTQRLRGDEVEGRSLCSLSEFSSKVRFTQKHELVLDQAVHEPYGSNLTFELKRYIRFCQTTGTTGRPLVWLDTAENWDWMLGNWGHIYRAAGVRPGDRVFFAFSFGPFLGFWTAFEAAAQFGFLCMPGGGLSSAARLRAIIEHEASVLLCTPTYALHLAEVALAQGVDLAASSITKIIVAGEAGGSIPQVRERISRLWNGARVIDHYGMTEVGPVYFETLEEPGVQHVIEDSYFAEIIDPQSGEPVDPGQMGELVLTPLGRFGTPLLRYRTGDLVRQMPGREGMALEGGVLGRVDDMIVVRGVNLYPGAIDAVVRSIPEIGEYRVDVFRRSAMSEVELQVETLDETALPRLERAFEGAFSLRIPVQRVGEGTLPRFEFKAQRWVRHP